MISNPLELWLITIPVMLAASGWTQPTVYTNISSNNMSTNKSHLLSRFQRQGDVEALIAYGESLGESEAGLRAAITLLEPIFESLSFGEQPHYERLDREQILLEHQREILFVVRCMVGSEAADMKTAGLHIMGVLDLAVLIQDLQKALTSEHDWERIEAVHALARMNHSQVRPILESVIEHPDPVTRRTAREAMQRWHPPLNVEGQNDPFEQAANPMVNDDLQ